MTVFVKKSPSQMFDKVLDTFWKETIDFVLVILVLKKYKHCSDVITITLNIF